MKLYRTRTQEEFDWLAEQANDKGYVFYERSVWEDYKENTVVYYLKDDKSYVSHEPVDLVRKQYPEEDYPIIEVSDLMGTVDHDTLMQRNNKPKPYTPPNTGDPWIDNLPESYFEMYEEAETDKYARHKEITDDKVNSPSHYTRGDIEVIDIIKQLTQGYEPFEAYLVGNTIKYLARANFKENKQQDLEKAEWHINKLLEEQNK